MKKRVVILGVYGVFLASSLIAVSVWPDDWPIYTPIAAIFGPFLAMWLGWDAWSYTDFFGEGLIAFFGVAILVLPFAFKTNPATTMLMILGVLLWCVVGLLAVQHLAA